MKKHVWKFVRVPNEKLLPPDQLDPETREVCYPSDPDYAANTHIELKLTPLGKVVTGLLGVTAIAGLGYAMYKAGEAETDRAWVGSLNALTEKNKETAEPAEGSVE